MYQKFYSVKTKYPSRLFTDLLILIQNRVDYLLCMYYVSIETFVFVLTGYLMTTTKKKNIFYKTIVR